MNPVRRTAVLMLAATTLATCSGCVLSWCQAKKGGPSTTTEMSGPEARRTLARARTLTYPGTAAGRTNAARLADSVIHHCGVHRYVWDAFLVKAVAAAEAGDYTNAQLAAAEGIRTILTLHPGPVDGDALRALKRLLPIYVESCAGAGAHKEGATALTNWRTVVLSRYAASPLAFRNQKESVRLEFNLLREMLEQYAAAREPESQIKSLVLAYIRHYNANKLHELAALFGDKQDWPPTVRRVFASKQRPDSAARRLYLASVVKVGVPTGTTSASSLSGEAVCDVMTTTAAGWARLTMRVRFSFVRDTNGKWLIDDINDHP